jgi:H+-transporting ATPase
LSSLPDFLPFDPTIKRTEGTVRNTKTGEEFKTTKGAPHILLNLMSDAHAEVKEKVEAEVVRFGEMGIRTLAVAKMDLKNGKNEWEMLGLLTFLDPPRPDTKQTIEDANKYGVSVKMVTGDHLLIAKQTAKTLTMGTQIFTSENLPMLDPETKQKPPDLGKTYGNMCLAADGFASMFPEHKVSVWIAPLW